jgi:alginate O-acetyltransferase complex protein AlgI
MWLGRMFGIGAAGLVDAIARYHFSGSWIILAIGIFASFPWGSKLGAKALKGENKLPVYISVVLYAVMLVLCIAGMMSSTYSSFLYFQF